MGSRTLYEQMRMHELQAEIHHASASQALEAGDLPGYRQARLAEMQEEAEAAQLWRALNHRQSDG